MTNDNVKDGFVHDFFFKSGNQSTVDSGGVSRKGLWLLALVTSGRRHVTNAIFYFTKSAKSVTTVQKCK